MTEEQYRKSAFREQLAAFIDSPAGGMALVILKDGSAPIDPKLDSPEVASVRVLSQAVGFNACLEAFIRLSQPFQKAEEPPAEDWGVMADQLPAEPGTM